MKTYQRIRLRQVPSELEETVTQFCFKSGANGCSEALKFKQPNLAYDPTIIGGREMDFDVYFTEAPRSEFFKGLSDISGKIDWECFEEEEKRLARGMEKRLRTL